MINRKIRINKMKIKKIQNNNNKVQGISSIKIIKINKIVINKKRIINLTIKMTNFYYK